MVLELPMKRLAIIVSLLAIIFLLSCDKGFFSTPIGSILKNPRDYEGRIVKISGVVTENLNIFIIKGFKIKDKTGEIFVITERILPKVGTEATVQGYVKEGFSIGNDQFIVIMEGSPG